METVEIKNNRKRRSRGPIIFLAVVIFLILIVWLLNSATTHKILNKSSDDFPKLDVDGKYIGRIYVEGDIEEGEGGVFDEKSNYFHAETLNAIDQMIDDKNNKGLYIYVDSPGGSVSTSDELYLKIKEYKEKTGGKRPVVAYFDDMAASGGYYISAPADKILANRGCWTGSIGVTIGNMYGAAGFMEKLGIRSKAITSGPNKAMGDPLSGLTKEQEDIFQSLVNEAYEQFTTIVSEGRGMDIETVKKLADGRIYTAKQALQNGLIDKIMTEDEANDYFLGMVKDKDVTIQDIVFERDESFFDILTSKMFEKKESALDRFTNEIIEGSGKFSISYRAPIDKH